MPLPIMPGDTQVLEFIFLNASGVLVDPTPAPTVDVFYTALDRTRTQPVTDAVMLRNLPALVAGRYFYALSPDGALALGTGIEVVATTTDAGIPVALRAKTRTLEAGGVDADVRLWRSGTPALLTGDKVNSQVSGIDAAVLALLSAVGITFNSPLLASGDLEIVRGDSYEANTPRSLIWTSTDWTVYTIASVMFKARTRYNATVFEKAGTMLSTSQVLVELSALETADFAVGREAYRYDIQATLTNSDTVTLAMGKIHVIEDVR